MLRRFLRLFRVGHLFRKSEIWEAKIAQWIGKKTESLEDNRGRFGKTMVVTIGTAYFVFAVVFQVVATGFLIALLWLLRFVVPLFYTVWVIWFGVASSVSLYRSVVLWAMPDDGILSLSHVGIMQIAPGLFAVVVYLTLYISMVYVIARMYANQVFSDG